MIPLIKYHTRSFLRSNKYIMPLLAYIIVLAIVCSSPISEVKVVYLVAAVGVYLVTAWSAFIYAECEDPITEQIALLKSKSSKQYYISKALFVCIWGMAYSVIGVIIPVLWNLFCMIVGSSAYDDMNIGNIIASLFINICLVVLGGMIGYLLHPRVFYNRKVGAIATFSFAVLGIIKGPLFDEIKVPFLKLLSWLFPPVYELIIGMNVSSNAISFSRIIFPCLYAVIYGAILAVINVIVIDKKGF